MDKWLLLALLILACYRLTSLVVYDEGPFSVFERVRTAAGVYALGVNGQPDTGLGRLLACPYCVGIYVALGLAFVPGLTIWLPLWWLAIAGGQSLLQSLEARRPGGQV